MSACLRAYPCLRLSFHLLAGLSLLATASMSAATPLEDLPLVEPGVSVVQVSSHNKRGLNGDVGFYLYDGRVEPNTLAGWNNPDPGATAGHNGKRVHGGSGALEHKVRRGDFNTLWRSVYKSLTDGFNLEEYNRLSFYVWPSHVRDGTDYGVRIDSGGKSTKLLVDNLVAGEWNHIELDLTDVPRKGVSRIWLLFNQDWGAGGEATFYVDDLTLLSPDGQQTVLDDFEKGRSRAVLYEAHGPGCIKNIWGLGSHDIEIEVDGKVIVDATQDDFFTGQVPGFPRPLVNRELVASGPWKCVSHFSFVPIGFEEHCRITTSHPAIFYHVTAEQYRTREQVASELAKHQVATLASDWKVAGPDPKRWGDLKTERGKATIEPQKSHDLLRVNSPGAVASIRIILPEDKRELDSLWICVDCDGKQSLVEAPLAFFFGAGAGWQDIPSHCFGIQGNQGYNHLPMPFWKNAVVRIENRGKAPSGEIVYQVDWRAEPYPRESAGYFRTRYHEGLTSRGRDWLLLETQGQGQLVAVVHRLVGGHYCEGDIRFHIDGSRSPALYGTGTEDYYHQACWPNKDNHTPYHGCVGNVAQLAEQHPGSTFYDFPACYYRVHLEAPVRFASSIRCGIEHGGVNDTDSTYASLAMWYAQDRVGLMQTDSESFADRETRLMTDYFEGDNDDVLVEARLVDATEPLECELAILPDNTGLRLRRTLDQSKGPQLAEVRVDGQVVGLWSDPDRNVYKRLAESDFEVDPKFTAGKKSVRVSFHPQGGVWTIGELRAFSHLPSGASLP